MTDLAALAKRMRKALGTGARVEDGQIVLQGDQRDVAGAWLSREGATVVLGN
jgi:translation initiation factor 1 (eIF-1/SUI1)